MRALSTRALAFKTATGNKRTLENARVESRKGRSSVLEIRQGGRPRLSFVKRLSGRGTAQGGLVWSGMGRTIHPHSPRPESRFSPEYKDEISARLSLYGAVFARRGIRGVRR